MKKLIFIYINVAFLSFSKLNASAQYTRLFDFAGTANGSYPECALYNDGTFLYGMSYQGSTYDKGILFKVKTDGTAYSGLLDFSGVINGSYPTGSLISDGTYLYGMTQQGGANVNDGTLFKVKTDGSGYVNLLNFSGVSTGRNPQGSLVWDGAFLYGMTFAGGLNNLGTLFKIMPDGSGFVKLLDFAGSTNGSNPAGSLFYDGTFLYGMTYSGGINDLGTIFKILTDGTGYVKLLDFAGAVNGSTPSGTLISDGNFLCGMTKTGGTNDFGTIFKIMPDGSGFIKLLDFAGALNGRYPFASLVFAGSFLAGMTSQGGLNDEGTIFKIMPDGSGFMKLLDFSAAAYGSYPYNSLISDGNSLYGTTEQGGVYGMGTIFRYQYSETGLQESSTADIHIFPNPARDELVINIRTSGNNIGMVIYNVLGERIYSPQQITSGQESVSIDISSLPRGIYFLKLDNSVRKFAKE